VVSEGRGLTNLFDDERVVEPLGRTSIDMTGWAFVGLLRGEFAGMNTITWLVFVQK
jgi:hypothetical protein